MNSDIIFNNLKENIKIKGNWGKENDVIIFRTDIADYFFKVGESSIYNLKIHTKINISNLDNFVNELIEAFYFDASVEDSDIIFFLDIQPSINFYKKFSKLHNKIIENFLPYSQISYIIIKKFHQFENFHIDLTYPQGHTNAGQPLKKICFIGQNGTGKTSIFRIIRGVINKIEFNKNSLIKIGFKTNNLETNYTLEKNSLEFPALPYIHFPADIFDSKKIPVFDIVANESIDFDWIDAKKTWELLKQEIIKHSETEKKERDKLNEIIYTKNADAIAKAAEEFKKWEEKHPTPLVKFAEKINPFLEKFNLRVKTEIDFREPEEIEFIQIENLQGETLGDLDSVLSTGTKQVLYTVMPLFSLHPEKAIILFDEPERSLYPDIQKEIIDFYVSLSPDSQFFFATHSPIIASNFEPWEIIELRFDKNGNVYQEKWYEGERHVDNYFKDPRMLSWDDILMSIYGLKLDGNELRIKTLMQVATLMKKLEKNKITEEEKKELKRLAKLVNYNFKSNEKAG